jgi:hypothetical protein
VKITWVLKKNNNNHTPYCWQHNTRCQLCIVEAGSRNISCMPRCRFNVLNVQWQKYIYYWSLEIFKKYILLLFIFFVLRHIALLVASLVVARNWSLAWAWSTQWLVLRLRIHLTKYQYSIAISNLACNLEREWELVCKDRV